MLFQKTMLAFLLLSASSILNAQVSLDGKANCQSDSIFLSTNFDTARVNHCVIKQDDISIKIKPENKPINDSPWYAFKLQANSEKQVSVRIKYYGGKHRYNPKISKDGVNWQAVPFKLKKGDLTFKLTLTDTPVYVAGQEIISNLAYNNWLDMQVKEHQVEPILLGNSVQGRPISAMLSKAQSNKYILVIGRQHPPEVTGALAYFPFSESLLKNTALRASYNILFVPNINPDGVALGHWRHNVNGVDLNRDWKQFKQPETVSIKNYLDNIVNAGGKIVYGIDFHSTHNDVFYSMPQGMGLTPDDTTVNWLARLAKAEPHFQVIDKPGHNPNRGVFKQWLSDTYGVHAVTYEMGDNTDRKIIKQVAISAADTFAETLLSYQQTQSQ